MTDDQTYLKTLNSIYLGPEDVVNMVEGEKVPARLLKNYSNKLALIGAIKAPESVEPTPSVKSKKKETK